ncbi:hypothetical protein LB505_012485 [Fusarium chuoi]|nr:hypothetical protein LB505_012485 [Fusarium chuoi]
MNAISSPAQSHQSFSPPPQPEQQQQQKPQPQGQGQGQAQVSVLEQDFQRMHTNSPPPAYSSLNPGGNSSYPNEKQRPQQAGSMDLLHLLFSTQAILRLPTTLTLRLRMNRTLSRMGNRLSSKSLPLPRPLNPKTLPHLHPCLRDGSPTWIRIPDNTTISIWHLRLHSGSFLRDRTPYLMNKLLSRQPLRLMETLWHRRCLASKPWPPRCSHRIPLVMLRVS